MNNTILNIITLLTGLIISSVAGFYSIIGLTTIFSGAFWPIFIMGAVLEIGKLVTVSWLYHNWDIVPRLIKYYLSSAIIVLMLITSIGIFGFLSKAHIEQQLNLNVGVQEQIQIVSSKINIHSENIKDIDTQIQQIDTALAKITSQGNAATSIRLADQQRKTRDSLIKRKQDETKLQSDLRVEKIKLESETRKIEAEVGPIKYVAELIYGSAEEKVVDKAIRIVIGLLIFVFDPLAVLLLVAFNISISRQKDDYANMEFLELTKQGKTKKKREQKTATLPVE